MINIVFVIVRLPVSWTVDIIEQLDLIKCYQQVKEFMSHFEHFFQYICFFLLIARKDNRVIDGVPFISPLMSSFLLDSCGNLKT